MNRWPPLIFFILLLKSSFSQPSTSFPKLDNAIPFESRLNDALKTLSSVVSLDLQGFKSVTSPIQYSPTCGIVLNVPELEILIKHNKHEAFISDIITFVILHEVGHQLQYAVYGEEQMKSACATERRLYECQADIIAGYYLMKYYSEVLDTELRPAFYEGLELLLDSDLPQLSLTSLHPNFSQRKQAVSFGLNVGSSDKDFSHSQLLKTTFEQSEKIINHCEIAGFDLMLVRDKVKYNYDDPNPTVKYELEYKNTGNEEIEFEFEVIQTYKSINNYKGLFENINNLNKHRIVLAPGETQLVSGSIDILSNIVRADLTLVYPPNKYQIATFMGSSCSCDSLKSTEHYYFTDKFKRPIFSINSMYALTLSQILDALLGDFKFYSTGPYILDDIKRYKVYNSKLVFPYSLTNEFVSSYDDKQKYFVADIYNGASIDNADDIYDDNISKLSAAIEKISVNYSTASKEDQQKNKFTKFTYFRLPSLGVLITLYETRVYTPLRNNFSVGLSISKYD